MSNTSNIPSFVTGAVSMRRDASVVSRDDAGRMVSLAFSSEVQVDRGNWIEVLSHAPGAVDLSRLRDGGALLENHDMTAQRGVVESAWIDADHRGRAVVRFSRTPQGEELFRDVSDGIKRHVSVGYSILDAQIVGESDDGTPIVVATKWQPYEVSIVAVPADVTVGVGRSVAPHPNQRNSASMKQNHNTRSREASIHNRLRDMMREAMTAQPFSARVPNGAVQPTGYIPTPTRRSMLVPLKTTSLVGLFDADGNLTHTPAGTLAGETITLSGAIIANSRVARAGAHVIIREESSNHFSVGNTPADVVLERQPARFVNVNAAAFGTIAVEDDDAPAVTLASIVKAADLTKNFGAAKLKAFTVTLKHSELRNAPVDDLLAEVLTATTLGLARAADEVLLSAITAANPDAFTLAALASRGLQLADIRGIAGTSATGAAIGADGVLRVAGVPAALSADMAGTLVGAWDRAAVAINDDVNLVWNRVNRKGDLTLSVFSTMLPVLPDGSAFWSVTA